MTLSISCCTANRLDQGSFRTKEAFLICIQNGYQRDLRNIQTFSQKVDTHQNIKYIQPHVADDFRPFQRINIRMQVLNPDAKLLHIVCQILSHPLGQGSDQHFMMSCCFFIDLAHQIINLTLYRPNKNLRIQKPCRADDLFCPHKLMLCLIRARRCGYKHHLIDLTLKFRKV